MPSNNQRNNELEFTPTFGTQQDKLAQYFKLSDEERKEKLNSGQSRFANRVGWAKTYMYKAKLLESPRKGHFKISDRGLEVLKQKSVIVNTKYLTQFDEFNEFQRKHREKKATEEETKIEITPEETLEKAYTEIRENLAKVILDKVVSITPGQFEKLVVELLVKMGYGGSIQDAGQAIGRSGDEGIDGVIKEDRLGLDKIYIQAKKWDPNKTVGRSEVQAFAGALLGKGATKGVFITTASFSKNAIDFNPANVTIIRIDGTTLAEYIIDNNVGVTTTSFYEIKRIDSDYFDMV
jgi:restriction system protein